MKKIILLMLMMLGTVSLVNAYYDTLSFQSVSEIVGINDVEGECFLAKSNLILQNATVQQYTTTTNFEISELNSSAYDTQPWDDALTTYVGSGVLSGDTITFSQTIILEAGKSYCIYSTSAGNAGVGSFPKLTPPWNASGVVPGTNIDFVGGVSQVNGYFYNHANNAIGKYVWHITGINTELAECAIDTDCGICHVCNSGSCVNAPQWTDPKDDCAQQINGCTTPYLYNHQDGLCTNQGTCWVGDTHVSAGYVCRDSTDYNIFANSQVNCGIWKDCVANQTSANEYYVGFWNDYCVDSDWQATGTTWNTTSGYKISVTEHAANCQEELIPQCAIDTDCGFCQVCSLGTCTPAPNGTDPKNECEPQITSCYDDYSYNTRDGNCNGESVCYAFRTLVADGHVCWGADYPKYDDVPNANRYCAVLKECVAGQTNATEYYAGYSVGGGSCSITDWQTTGRTFNTPYGHNILTTENVAACTLNLTATDVVYSQTTGPDWLCSDRMGGYLSQSFNTSQNKVLGAVSVRYLDLSASTAQFFLYNATKNIYDQWQPDTLIMALGNHTNTGAGDIGWLTLPSANYLLSASQHYSIVLYDGDVGGSCWQVDFNYGLDPYNNYAENTPSSWSTYGNTDAQLVIQGTTPTNPPQGGGGGGGGSSSRAVEETKSTPAPTKAPGLTDSQKQALVIGAVGVVGYLAYVKGAFTTRARTRRKRR